MAERGIAFLPLHELLKALDSWCVEPSQPSVDALRDALAGLLEAYDVRGAHVVLDAPPLPLLKVGAGTLASGPEVGGPNGLVSSRSLALGDQAGRLATIWIDSIDGVTDGVEIMADALELALGAISARQEARLQGQQLAALDAAVRGIAGALSIDTVLQLIVDRVRELAAAEYAALGIFGPFGNIEQFVTSGLSMEARARIGALPRGHGLLGLIVREDSSFLIDDIATDDRRHGFPPHHPEMHSFLGVPVHSKGRTIGNLYLTNKRTAPTFSEADRALVEMFALHAGIAIENARLHEEIQRLAVVDERQRISQDLHDSIIQSLYATSLSLEDLPAVMAEDSGEGAARTERAIDSIHATIRDIRNFIMGLQPELLEEADLPHSITALAAEFRANTLVDLEVRVADELADPRPDQAAHVLAITREALSNIARHSQATRASLALDSDDGVLRLAVGDNGKGFDIHSPRSGHQRGLANLRSRAEAAGGRLTLTSGPGAGTHVVVEIPVRAEG